MQAKSFNPPLLTDSKGCPWMRTTKEVINSDGLAMRFQFAGLFHIRMTSRGIKGFNRFCHAMQIACEEVEGQTGWYTCYGPPNALGMLAEHPSVIEFSPVPRIAQPNAIGQGACKKR